MSQTWILDIDGTLMPTHAIDNDCYWRAVHECFGGAPQAINLAQFQHVSDSGILFEWMEKTHGRAATEQEFQKIRDRFLALIEQAFANRPDDFAATTGLAEWLDGQLARHQGSVAIATGGWGHTARFKLQAAALDHYGLPLASSDDATHRTEIMLKAQTLLNSNVDSHGTKSAICYIGDGIWDYRASQSLDWDFIGIASGARADVLRQAGAENIFCNFSELTASKAAHAKTSKLNLNARF